MTTIAYRDGVMAADTGMTYGDTVAYLNMRKLVRVEHKGRVTLGGCSGIMRECQPWLDWVASGMTEPEPLHRKSNALRVERDTSGTVRMWLHEAKATFEVFDEPYLADGSGYLPALTAMWMGGTAERAVEAGLRFDQYTAGKVATVAFGNVVIVTPLGPKKARKGGLSKRAKNATMPRRGAYSGPVAGVLSQREE